MSEKTLQHNLEAEQFVLGSILIDNEAILKVIDLLRPESFHKAGHRKIYAAILELFERNEPVDLLTLAEQLKKKGQLDEVGGASYLAAIMNMVPTAANIRSHALIVREKEILRGVSRVAHELLEESMSAGIDAGLLLDKAEMEIFKLSGHRTDGCFRKLRDLIVDSFKDIEAAASREGFITGVETGLIDLDRYTLGFQPTDLVIIAARPSMGKTALAVNAATHFALKERKAVAFFSLEMSSSQIALRMLCSEARVNSMKLRAGFLKKEDWPKLTRAAGVLAEAPVFIDDTPGISAFDVKARARRLRKEHGLGLIVIDYLQLMRWRNDVDGRQWEISETCRALKELAKELEIPVVVLSQLNRSPEYRKDKRPQLSDLRESGAIEQDADVVLFIHKPEYDEDGDLREIIIGKQRNGPVAALPVSFIPDYAKFESYSSQTGKRERRDLE